MEPTEDNLEKIPPPTPCSVLDVATGPGCFAIAAAERGATHVVGVDSSEAMIDEARKLMPPAHADVLSFAVGDAAALPAADASVDAVVLGFVLLHLPDPAAALSEAFRVLKPGGRLAFSVWQPPPHNLGFEIMLDAIAKKGNPHVELPGARGTDTSLSLSSPARRRV